MRAIAYIFIFFCFFPYIDLIGLGTDTQPNALLLSAIILFTIKNKKINKPIILLWLMFAMSIVLALFSNLGSFETLKNVFNYLSPPMICFASYTLYQKMGFKIGFKLFSAVVVSYFFVAFVQYYFDPNFMTFLLNQGGRGVLLAGRGVVSLCPEPAFYGSLCLFFLVFSLMSFNRKQNLFLVPLLIIQLIFFSKTATAIAVLFIALLSYMAIQLLRFRLKPALLMTSLIFVGLIVFKSLPQQQQEGRAVQLFEAFVKDPLLFTKVDVSAAVRITSSYSPFMALRYNAFLPMGMGNYKSFVSQRYRDGHYPKLINKYVIDEIDRLGGGINMVLFHLGFFGLVFPIAIYLAFKRLIKNAAHLFAFIVFVILLFTQIQMMQSMIGLILATAIYQSNLLREQIKLADGRS